MGVRRYSRFDQKREEYADHLARECNSGFEHVTIGDLIDAGFHEAEWACRRGGCYHTSKTFQLARFKVPAIVNRLRWNFVCSECGTKGPKLRPIWTG